MRAAPAPVRRSPPRRPARPRDTARALFRDAILVAAEAVFAEHGFHGARIQDIALRAGIAVGTVYNHFEQKEDVLRALLDERTEALLAQLEVLPGDPQGFEAKLTARVARLLAYIDHHRGFFALAMDHGLLGARTSAAAGILGGKDPRHLARFRDAFQALVDEGAASNALEPIGPARLARLLGGIIRAFTVGALLDAKPLADEAPLIVTLFLHGAVARKPAPRRRAR